MSRPMKISFVIAVVATIAIGIVWFAMAVDNAVNDFKATCRDTYNGEVTEEQVFRGMTPIYGPNGQITGWSQNWGTHFECLVNGTRVDELDI